MDRCRIWKVFAYVDDPKAPLWPSRYLVVSAILCKVCTDFLYISLHFLTNSPVIVPVFAWLSETWNAMDMEEESQFLDQTATITRVEHMLRYVPVFA